MPFALVIFVQDAKNSISSLFCYFTHLKSLPPPPPLLRVSMVMRMLDPLICYAAKQGMINIKCQLLVHDFSSFNEQGGILLLLLEYYRRKLI